MVLLLWVALMVLGTLLGLVAHQLNRVREDVACAELELRHLRQELPPRPWRASA